MSTCQKSATYSKDEIFGTNDSDSMCDLYGVTWAPGGGARGTPESLYREALPQGPNPYHFIYHFWQEGY